MRIPSLENTRITEHTPVPSPFQLHREIPVGAAARRCVQSGRASLEQILDRKDRRLFLVVGPCSIHDPAAALDYAARLRELADEVSDQLLIVMRVYFEKPRTTVGWKGLINDPHLDDRIQTLAEIGEKG